MSYGKKGKKNENILFFRYFYFQCAQEENFLIYSFESRKKTRKEKKQKFIVNTKGNPCEWMTMTN